MTDQNADSMRTTYRSVFSTRGFGALWAGNALSLVATSLLILAFSVTVYDETGSALWSSLAFAAGFLPQALGGLVLPSLADRLPARVVLPAGCALRAAQAGVLAAGVLGPAGGLVVIAVGAVLQPFFTASQSTVVSRLLHGDRYVLGRSLFTITSMTAQLVGLGLGGAWLQALGPAPALGPAAAVQAAAGIVLVVGLPTLPVVTAARGRWSAGETVRGYRRLLRIPLVRRLLALWWTPLSLFVGAESLAVAYAGAMSADGWATALLLAGPPAGAFAGEVVVGRLVRPDRREHWIMPMILVLGAGLLPFAVSPPLPIAIMALAASGFGLAYALGRQGEFRDALPVTSQSVGFGLLGTGMMVAQGVGPLLAGPLGAWWGAGPAMATCGALVLVTGLPLWHAARRAERRPTRD